MDVRFWLACYGLSAILLDSEIMQSPRFWLVRRFGWLRGLLVCYLCTGMWVSAALTALRRAVPTPGTEALLDCLSGAAACYLLGLLAERLSSPK